jgi:ribosomal protein L37E
LSGQVTGGGSYSQGSSASFSSSQNMIQVSKDTRYVFSRWSGDYTGTSLSGSITMDASKTVTAVYQLQYYLTVTVQPSNAPSPNGSGWYNAGDTVPLAISSQTVGGSDGTRLNFNGWSVDGNNQGGSALNLQMNTPHTVTAQYTQQYYLKIVTDQGVASGEGWYDAGSYAQISVSNPPNPSYGVSVIFNGWQGDSQSATQSTSVMVNGPKVVTATWRTDSTVLYETIAAILVAIALIAAVGFYSSTRRKRGTSTMDSCSRCGRPFRSTNNYCVSCGAPRRTDVTSSNKPEAPTP